MQEKRQKILLKFLWSIISYCNYSMKIVDECMVSFPSDSDSVNPTTSPLTLFDVPWLLFPPIQPLFFFQLPPNARCSDFSFDILPRLKCSLSSALHCYFPVAGKLTTSLDNPDKLTFFSGKDCCVRFTVAHSDADFEYLCSYLPRDSGLFYQLVPSLPPIFCSPISPTPLFALQITYFPPKTPNLSSSGFSIGIAYHPVLCDQRTFCSFLHSWASFCKFGQLYESSLSPTFDRSVILDPNGLCPILWGQLNSNSKLGLSSTITKPTDGLLRATFVMDPTDIQNAKGWIMGLCDERNRPYPVLLSPYIVSCAFVCVCLVQSSVHEYEGPMYFGFIAGGITRLNYRVPVSYFGNCVGFGRAVVKREELLSEGGILAAVDALAISIKGLDTDVLWGAENWISEWELIKGSEEHISVVGSPKVKLYETDFGWGRPKKIEEISIDVMRGISLTQSRDMKGGIEIGLALSNSRMEAFCALFNQGLHCFSSGGIF